MARLYAAMSILNIVLYQTHLTFTEKLAVTKVNMRLSYKEWWVFDRIQTVSLVVIKMKMVLTIIKLFPQTISDSAPCLHTNSDNGVANI